MRRLIYLLPFVLIFSLSSCSTERSDQPLIYITDTAGVSLLPTSEMDGVIDELQYIKAQWDGRTFGMNALLISDAERLLLLAIGDMGQELFEINYDEKGTTIHGMAGTAGIDPSYVVMDLQLAYYKSESLSRHFRSHGLEFEEKTDGNDLMRTVVENGVVILEVRISPERIAISNILRGYHYIATRELDGE